MASGYNGDVGDTVISLLQLIPTNLQKPEETLLKRIWELSATMRNQHPTLAERSSFVTPVLDALFNEEQVKHCVSAALAHFQIVVDKLARESAKDNLTAEQHLIHVRSSKMLRDFTDYGVIRSFSKELLTRLTRSRVLVVDLPDELISNILGMLVDYDGKVYDNEESDIGGSNSTYRALQLTSVCRRFHSIVLAIPGAWAVVTPEHPGHAFLTMCAKRSMDKGLRLFLGSLLDSSALKLVRNLFVARSVCRITSISARVKCGSPSWARVEDDGVLQLLGKLDNSILKTLNIRYLEKFKFDSNIDDDEQVEDGQAEDDDSDDGRNVDIGELSLSSRRASYELQPLLCSQALQAVSFENTIPLTGFMHSIAKLSIKLGASYFPDEDKWDVRDLVNLLQSQPAVEDFALEFYESRTFEFGHVADDKLELPSLKSLNLHWHASTEFTEFHLDSSNDIPRLFKLLDLKNVKTFRFEISAEFKEDFEAELQYERPLLLQDHLSFFLSPNEGYFQHLESFHLSLYSGSLKEVRLPTSYIQSIRRLSLQFNIGLTLCELDEEPDGIPGALPQLQTVTLRNCDTFTAVTVQSIVEAIKRGGNWESFRQLLVDQCRYLSWSLLESIVELGKLEVYPNTRIFRTYDDDDWYH